MKKSLWGLEEDEKQKSRMGQLQLTDSIKEEFKLVTLLFKPENDNSLWIGESG